MKKIQPPQQPAQAPLIILVRPQMAENIGMTARALMSCALYDLRLVQPRENHLSEKAVSASSGAAAILEQAQVFDTLEEALRDIHFVLATTARPRGMTKSVYTPIPAMEKISDNLIRGGKCAILFGAERTGLENDELVMADGLIEIPLNPLHCSLNLSQAVLLIGYEWIKRTQQGPLTRYETGGSAPATKGELEAFLSHLESELDKRGYFRFFDKKERMRRNLRNIFTRNALTGSEIKTLYGVVNDLIRTQK
ncbi:MAG: RNA methyltransferase [Alphaproteobacteria bacterium]